MCRLATIEFLDIGFQPRSTSGLFDRLKQRLELNKALSDYAATFQNKLPIKVNEHTALKEIRVGWTSFTYVYVTSEITESDVTVNKQKVSSGICDGKLGGYTQKGETIIFEYTGPVRG